MLPRLRPFALLLAVSAASAPVAAEARLRIVTTFTVIADMARRVAGDAADVEAIVKPGADVHNYQPTPSDVLRAQKADLVLWNGLGLELWFDRYFAALRDVPAVIVSDGVVPIGVGAASATERPNPHAWMSPKAAVTYVGNIRDALVAHDPAQAAIFRANADAFIADLEAIDADLAARFAAVPEPQRWLVTSEGAFSYFARDYGLGELYLWPINADQQGTPQQVRRVIDGVREHRVRAVFSESTVSDRPARQVARETGARYGGVLYVDSLSPPDGPVPTYRALLEVTGRTVADALADAHGDAP